MHVLMNIQNALLIEYLITYFTGIKALTTIYVFMVYQTTLVTVCFITYFTATPALSTMYALICCYMTILTECPIHTSHEYGRSPLYTRICLNRLLLLLYALMQTSPTSGR